MLSEQQEREWVENEGWNGNNGEYLGRKQERQRKRRRTLLINRYTRKEDREMKAEEKVASISSFSFLSPSKKSAESQKSTS